MGLPAVGRASSAGRRGPLRRQGGGTQLRENRYAENCPGWSALASPRASANAALIVGPCLLPENFPASQFLNTLGTRFRLYHHLPHCRAGSRRALLPPGLQPLASFFDVLEKMWILESGPPCGNDRPHAVPHHPNLAVAFEKQFVVDQPAVHDAGDHVPVADHHADVSVFLAALRIL